MCSKAKTQYFIGVNRGKEGPTTNGGYSVGFRSPAVTNLPSLLNVVCMDIIIIIHFTTIKFIQKKEPSLLYLQILHI